LNVEEIAGHRSLGGRARRILRPSSTLAFAVVGPALRFSERPCCRSSCWYSGRWPVAFESSTRRFCASSANLFAEQLPSHLAGDRLDDARRPQPDRRHRLDGRGPPTNRPAEEWTARDRRRAAGDAARGVRCARSPSEWTPRDIGQVRGSGVAAGAEHGETGGNMAEVLERVADSGARSARSCVGETAVRLTAAGAFVAPRRPRPWPIVRRGRDRLDQPRHYLRPTVPQRQPGVVLVFIAGRVADRRRR